MSKLGSIVAVVAASVVGVGVLVGGAVVFALATTSFAMTMASPAI